MTTARAIAEAIVQTLRLYRDNPGGFGIHKLGASDLEPIIERELQKAAEGQGEELDPHIEALEIEKATLARRLSVAERLLCEAWVASGMGPDQIIFNVNRLRKEQDSP